MQQVPCKACGELIFSDTAVKNGGLCIPCKRGYREAIEAGKRIRKEQQTYEKSAERKYWLSLVSRVHGPEGGIEKLSVPERTYFALGCLIGEVYSGGLHQFFFNNSGSVYGLALNGLLDVEAHDTAALLSHAKELVFGTAPIPLDTAHRRALLNGAGCSPKLRELDRAFWKNEEELEKKCQRYASSHELYSGA